MRRALFLTIAISLAPAAWVAGIGPANAIAPCCAISAIDARSGIVTAQDAASQRSFQFKVADPAQLRKLKVGQKVFADFTAKTVTLAANQRPCCQIIQTETVPPIAGGAPLPAPGPGTKSVSTEVSVLNPAIATVAVNPKVMLPDPIPAASSYISSCSWNESQGETCESQCPPVTVNFKLGTKNASSRRLTGLVTVRLLAHPSGSVVREWSVTDLAGSEIKMPGYFTRTIVRCHPPGQSTVSNTPPNHNLVVQTDAAEADKNNNSRLIYIEPGSPISP